jgi:type VI protein secretion system component VasK
MNWLIIALDIMFALVAAVLGILGHGTFKSIKHLSIGKSFWIPVFVSGILFVFGSVVRIFHEFAVEYSWIAMSYTDEIIRISWLLAITILFGSIYNYSRKVKIIIKATTQQTKKEAELTGLKKQTHDLLKQVEKLKAQKQ